jgi:hypothetical protein
LECGEVEASWKYIDSVVNNLGKVKMDTYMPFSEGLEIK